MQTSSAQLSRPALLASVWISTLVASDLPRIVWQELVGPPEIWLLGAKVVFLSALMLLSLVWEPARPLRQYFGVLLLLTLLLSRELMDWVLATRQWQAWFRGIRVPPFSQQALAIQLRQLSVALTMIGVLFLMKRRRRAFFLATGRLDAPVEGVKWLGTGRRLTWSRFALALSMCAIVGIIGYLVTAGRPGQNMLTQVLPILPAVLLFATNNAFSEEMNYRAAVVAPVYAVVGKKQAMLLTGAFFGVAHYLTGVPGGLVGVALTGVLGWLLAKSMLETRGYFWAWFIHFWGDVPIFFFMATGSMG